MEVMGGIGVRGAGDSGVGTAGWDPTEVLCKKTHLTFTLKSLFAPRSLFESSSRCVHTKPISTHGSNCFVSTVHKFQFRLEFYREVLSARNDWVL